jgi:4-hydroxybenzoate polyprenyltransferase
MEPSTRDCRNDVALVVDLDQTILKSDLLLESALVLFGHNPWSVFLFPIWLLRGKARLKKEIASRVELNVAHLPWDERIVGLVHEAAGLREVVLCTGSDEKLATAVADHLGGFDVVIASDGHRNVSGSVKAMALSERYGVGGFDYVGNERVDLEVWTKARRAIVANGPPSLVRAAAKVCEVETYFPGERTDWTQWIKALRLHQWLKNILVFVPMLAAHRFYDPTIVLECVLGFLAFGLCSSSVYLLNDLLDLEADRQHPSKRERPFAAGRLSLMHGLIVSPLLTIAAGIVSFWVSPLFLGVLALYYALTLAYSLWLKKRVIVDVVVLAGLYTIRIIAGSVLLLAAPSFWLLAFSMFLFLSLAMLKRYTELRTLLTHGKSKSSGRGYAVDDLQLLQTLGTASGFQAILVLALYINSSASELLYRHPQVLWLLCPLLLYWIIRAWMIAHRGLMRDDPVVFAATDRTSQIIALVGGVIVIGAI